jgi:hypothetical protein
MNIVSTPFSAVHSLDVLHGDRSRVFVILELGTMTTF